MWSKGSKKVSHLPEVTQPAMPGHGFFEMINFWVTLTAHRHTPSAQCRCHMSIPPKHLLMDSSTEQIRGRCRSGKRKEHMAFGAASPGHPAQQSGGASALLTFARLCALRRAPFATGQQARLPGKFWDSSPRSREGRWQTDWPFAPNQGRFSSNQKLAVSLPDPQSPRSLAEP